MINGVHFRLIVFPFNNGDLLCEFKSSHVNLKNRFKNIIKAPV